MNKIIGKRNISEELIKFEIKTSIAVKEINVGQYIILTIKKNEPGIPFAILKTNTEKETITIIVSATDKYTQQFAHLNLGDEIFKIEGPFGHPAQIENFGPILCVGRGSGIISLLPVLIALKNAGNHITTLLSGQTKEGIILQNEIKTVSDEMIILTEDGSIGEKVSVCNRIEKIPRNSKINQVFVIGPASTIKATCAYTSKRNIPAQAFMHLGKVVENGIHPIFKVSVCGPAMAVCVDGYNFNAYYPNFNEMMKRFGNGDFNDQTKNTIPQREAFTV